MKKLDRKHLKDSDIEKFKSSNGKEQILWDGKERGLGVCATPKGEKRYILIVWIHTFDEAGNDLGKNKKIKMEIKKPGVPFEKLKIEGARRIAAEYKLTADEKKDPREIGKAAERAVVEKERAEKAEDLKQRVTALEAWGEYVRYSSEVAQKGRWGDRHKQDHITAAQEGGTKRSLSKALTQPGVLRSLLEKRLVDIDLESLLEWIRNPWPLKPIPVVRESLTDTQQKRRATIAAYLKKEAPSVVATRDLTNLFFAAETAESQSRRQKRCHAVDLRHDVTSAMKALGWIENVTQEDGKAWQVRTPPSHRNQVRQGAIMFRAFWNWCGDESLAPHYAAFVKRDITSTKAFKNLIPAAGSKGASKDAGKREVADLLTLSQLPGWFDAARRWQTKEIGAYLQILLLTGARRRELELLKWDDLDLNGTKYNDGKDTRFPSMLIRDKVNSSRRIPITNYVVGILKNLEETRVNQWVFSSPSSKDGRIVNVRKAHVDALVNAHKKAREQRGDPAGGEAVPTVTLHGLRRTFISLARTSETMGDHTRHTIVGHSGRTTEDKHYTIYEFALLYNGLQAFETWILERAEVDPKAQLRHPF